MQVLVINDDVVWAYNEQYTQKGKCKRIGFHENCNLRELERVIEHLSHALENAQFLLKTRSS